MARLTIYKDCGKNVTSISNHFIDEYMTGANDIQLKVYLCLLRMLGANQATSVSDLAERFNHTERDIVRALKYWEKQKLLTLDYDAGGIPVGIHIRDLESDYEAMDPIENAMSQSLAIFMEHPEQTERPQSVSAKQSARKNASSPSGGISYAKASDDLGQAVYDDLTGGAGQMAYSVPTGDAGLADYANDKRDREPERPVYEKPVYSASDIREFKNREETKQIMYIAESYIGRPLTPGEMKSLLFFTDELQFSMDLIDHLIAYCVERGKKDFKYIERVAINWAENNVSTPAQAKRFSKKYDKNVYSIMNALGKNNAPTNKEAEYITRWIGEYGFDMDVILEACDRTVLATDRHRLEYAESILSSWYQENVRRKADIRKLDELYQQKKSAGKAAKPSGSNGGQGSTSGNKFNQFTQNSYDFDALEKELLSN